tara:strand:- start:1332 stop:2117 length:786 start_codon:yes stop_codon:yes gene_type:complete
MLSKDALFNRFRHFKLYQPAFAEKKIHQAMKNDLNRNPIKGIQIIFPGNDLTQGIQIKAKNREQMLQAKNKISLLDKKYRQKYLEHEYQQYFTNYEGNVYIKPNHRRIAKHSASDLKVIKPLILKEVSIKNTRKVSNYVLGFVQSIPYSDLESKETSSGSGFNPPLKLLWENQGDCESKVTLAITMLRALMPRISMVLIFIDQHAFIGIAIPPKGDEMTLTENNITYVLAEPTGPGLFRLGQLPLESEQAILNGHYAVEVY